jgi:DNA-directed RNA polymerase sigma subunit (sigma70/sigma32)
VIPDDLRELSEFDLARVLRPLSHEERRIIRMRFGLGGYDPKTLAEVSEATGIPREVIRQTEIRAMVKLGWITVGA